MKLISCEIFFREMCAAVARSPHYVDIEFLPKGLHDIGSAKMLARMQEAVDRVQNYDAILLGYGLCNNGLAGLTARTIPVVLPRAHDCITMFLGSKERYLEYFYAHPGVYFKTTGWIERGEANGELHQLSVQNQLGIDMAFEKLVAKYGEENARYIYDQLGGLTKNYGQFTFIEMGVEPNGGFEQHTREEAQERGWKFEKVQGDLSMIQRLVDGIWDEKEFLVVPPGSRVVTNFNESIVAAEEAGRDQP